MENTAEIPTSAPNAFAWIVDGRLVAAERLGGGGRSHRVTRRIAAQAWWREQGVTDIVSAMRTRHGIADYALDGFAVHHFPLVNGSEAGEALAHLAQRVEHLLARDRCVLVHVDRPNGWLAGVDASLRCALGIAGHPDEALLQAARDGFPLDEEAELLLRSYSEAAEGVKLA